MNNFINNNLIFENIYFSYNAIENNINIFKDLNLTIKKGYFTSIIGPSGSGKTSLLKLASGLLEPNNGIIKFENKELIKIKKKITLVQQNVSLMPWLNVHQNIAFGIQNKGLILDNEIIKVITDVGLEGFSNFFPNQLSGGMSQRVAIARALVFKPKLLLLDEPFGALDNLSRELIASELVAIIKKELGTVIMVTHSIEEAALLSDEVLIMGGHPLRLIKRCIPPKLNGSKSWQKLGLRKSLEVDSFQYYLKLIREQSYKIFKKGN